MFMKSHTDYQRSSSGSSLTHKSIPRRKPLPSQSKRTEQIGSDSVPESDIVGVQDTVDGELTVIIKDTGIGMTQE